MGVIIMGKNLNCDIFLCYRGEKPLLAKNFKVYVDNITNSVDDDRVFGKVWYSDAYAKGKYKDDNDLKQLLFSAKYFIIFYFDGFFNGFLKDGKVNEDCVTAKEFYYAELARQENKKLEFIVVNMDNAKFNKKERELLEKFFTLKNIIKDDTINAFCENNNNIHILRQNSDVLLYERLLESINPENFTKEHIEFGSYPKTLVEDEIMYLTLNEQIKGKPSKDNFNGWKSYNYYYNGKKSDNVFYIDIIYDNNKYRGLLFLEFRPFMTIGKKSYLSKLNCEKNKIYWFKYEKLSWDVLTYKNNRSLLVCKDVIDSQPINFSVDDINGIPANNYANSMIRKWLNNEFYNIAFNDLEKNKIKDSTFLICNDSTCEIKDYVFLLSTYQIKKYYTQVSERNKTATDYAKYQGVYITKHADWFLRTPSSTSDTDTYFIDGYSGEIEEDLVIYTNGGIVPALVIKK